MSTEKKEENLEKDLQDNKEVDTSSATIQELNYQNDSSTQKSQKQETVLFLNGRKIKVSNLPIIERKQWVSFRPGDTIKIHYLIKEGDKERIQIFEGTVIRLRGEDLNKTFTVRKISYGVGVERTFPYHSPWIANIELVKRGKVRRARLYYLRKKIGKAGKIKEILQAKKKEVNAAETSETISEDSY